MRVTDFRTLGFGAVMVIVGCGEGRGAIHDGSPMDGAAWDSDATMIAFGSFVYRYQLRDSSLVVTVPAAGDIDVNYGGVTHCMGTADTAALASFVALSLAFPTRQALADPAPCPGTSSPLIGESMELLLAGGPTISKTMTERCTDGPIVELRAGVRTLTACQIDPQDGSASP